MKRVTIKPEFAEEGVPAMFVIGDAVLKPSDIEGAIVVEDDSSPNDVILVLPTRQITVISADLLDITEEEE